MSYDLPMRYPPLGAAALLLILSSVTAVAPAHPQEDSSFDRIWHHRILYEDTRGDQRLHRIALSGRLQAEAAWFDADEGDFDDTTWRRFRFGFVSRFRSSWRLHVEADLDLNESGDEWYEGLTDAYLGWRPSPSTELKLLKQSAGFTLDGATSSKKLLTLQRNNLTENLWFTEEYFTGITLAGEMAGHWSYKAGVFASDDADEIGVTDASYFIMTSLGRDLTAMFDLDEASARLDFVYNDRDARANTPDLSRVLSLSSRWRRGAWHLHTDLAAADGYFDQSDLRGAVFMPFYDISKKLQLVARYTYLDSDDDNGLSFNRYENEIAGGLGNEYHEIYAGLNLFFYGHKLKWQTGAQYTDMNDDADDGGEYSGWGITTGLRIYW